MKTIARKFGFIVSLLILTINLALGQATLPFSYDLGKPSGVTGLTHTGLGTDYSASPKMKFDTSGDWLLLNFSGSPGTLSFDIKWNQSTPATRFPGDFTLQESSDGTTFTTVQLYNTTSGTALPNGTIITESFSSLNSGSRYIKWIYTSKSNGNIAVGNISLLAPAGTSTISVDPASISNFSYVEGAGPSSSQTYNLSGTNLTGAPGNITVTGSTNYEVSTDNSSFSSSVNVSYGSATLSSTQVYARLKAGLAAGDYNTETVSNAGGGATTVNVTCSGTVYKTEPSNHVTGFAAAKDGTYGYNRINLSWVENDGSVVADGYLIKASTAVNISDPVDGTAVSDNTTIGSDSGAMNIAHGTASYQWTGLSASTTYYFKIYPYTNSGTAIDYKTTATVPNSSALTDAAPTLPNAWINEIHYDNGVPTTDANEGIEVIIENPGSYNLSDFKILLYNGSDGTVYDDLPHTLDGFTTGSSVNNLTIYYKMIPGLQNGAPDGLALSYQSNIIQFLSYEGSFTATAGDAIGLTSTDIGVAESSTTTDTQSLQLTGSGTKYSDFTWAADLTQTWGTPNNGGDQSLPVTLSLWDATSKNGQVVLNWTTDSEIENLGFIIERGLTDKGPWDEIATFSDNNGLKGQGSTNNTTNYQFTDDHVDIGATYYYRLSDVDYKGVRIDHAVISVVVSGKDQNAIPGSFSLERIYPNPFNPSTTVSFTVNEATDIAVNLFDVNGRLVSRLTNNRYESGNYNVRWNGLTRDGQPAPSGIYLVQISNNQSSLTRKVVLAR